MKETGLMFKAPLVRAILEGRKTQTRRIIKNQPFDVSWSKRDHEIAYVTGRASQGDEADGLVAYTKHGGGSWCAKSPVGQPGDRIYVRETWAYGIHAMGAMRDEDGPFVFAADGTTEGRLSDQWLPSIHMPKHAARIWLEITGVRIERLQSISRGDAMAEGCPFPNMANGPDPREWFSELWNTTGGDWAANPWVWVIDFKTISTTGRPA